MMMLMCWRRVATLLALSGLMLSAAVAAPEAATPAASGAVHLKPADATWVDRIPPEVNLGLCT